jgi:hypothetical protein
VAPQQAVDERQRHEGDEDEERGRGDRGAGAGALEAWNMTTVSVCHWPL